MGSVRGGPRRPNTTVYFVALAGILVLLLLLCCYFFYFCVRKVKELTSEDSPLNEPRPAPAPPRTTYPVQPVVRNSATAMAKLCKQIPTKTDTVFPAAVSPAPTHSEAGESGTTSCATATTDTSHSLAQESVANSSRDESLVQDTDGAQLTGVRVDSST